ncbi:MAG: glutamyl-tRNA reductase [Gammaproteobacteria bacterium CG22_combo_CG10-13_8_21_14_all_40_8]|nr:MAG: glutamyl-tRNA reductase [Gammaproteobacteria bacterium CG22_combo_CG10-13_8_21_14_all_40_8]
MYIIVIGINHNTAPVEIRGKVTFHPEQLNQALTSLQDYAQLEEVSIISTCNRTEVYAVCEKYQPETIIGWVEDFHGLKVDDLLPYVYKYTNLQAISHIMGVSCGLDSMVLGEPQILGQLKQSYQHAREAGTLRTRLEQLFQQTFSIAKKVRTETDIGSSAVSVAFAAVSLAKQLFSDLKTINALFIGAGETIELAARHLYNQGVRNMVVANRTMARAAKLANEFGASVISLDEIPDALPQTDIVISSTGSPLPIIGKGMVERALKKRKRRPIFMVDLAVPNDIESEVAELSDIYLYTVDDLNHVIQENMKCRESAKTDALQMIEKAAEQFEKWLNSLQGVSVIREFRTQIESLAADELNRAIKHLGGNEMAIKVLRDFAHRLTNKYMHHPTRYLQHSSLHGDKLAVDKVREMFELNMEPLSIDQPTLEKNLKN